MGKRHGNFQRPQFPAILQSISAGKNPLDYLTGKKVLFLRSTARSIFPSAFMDTGQTLADRIAAIGEKMATTKTHWRRKTRREALQAFSKLQIAETSEFLKKNPGKDEGASWKFDITTPFDQRVARIAEVDLPEARGFLTTLFNDMNKIIETVDINLTKPKYGDNHQQFVTGRPFESISRIRPRDRSPLRRTMPDAVTRVSLDHFLIFIRRGSDAGGFPPASVSACRFFLRGGCRRRTARTARHGGRAFRPSG